MRSLKKFWHPAF